VRVIFYRQESCAPIFLAFSLLSLSRIWKQGNLRSSSELAITHVKSTAWPIGGAAIDGSSGKIGGFEEMTRSARLNNTGSYNEAGDAWVESSCSWSFYFGLSTVTVSQIHGMVNIGVFADGMAVSLGKRPCQNPMPTKLWCLRNFSLLVSGCLHTMSFLLFC
jgi:hypothetical protein